MSVILVTEDLEPFLLQSSDDRQPEIAGRRPSPETDKTNLIGKRYVNLLDSWEIFDPARLGATFQYHLARQFTAGAPMVPNDHG
jgi:hypothetical protein